jgi:hypothetical protein
MKKYLTLFFCIFTISTITAYAKDFDPEVCYKKCMKKLNDKEKCKDICKDD